MENYVLVKVEGHNYTIGRREYGTRDEAVARQSELAKIGINFKVMKFRDAVGA